MESREGRIFRKQRQEIKLLRQMGLASVHQVSDKTMVIAINKQESEFFL